jgi:hypothetical protein
MGAVALRPVRRSPASRHPNDFGAIVSRLRLGTGRFRTLSSGAVETYLAVGGFLPAQLDVAATLSSISHIDALALMTGSRPPRTPHTRRYEIGRRRCSGMHVLGRPGVTTRAPTAWSAVTFRASAKHERETRTVHRKPVEVPQSKTAGLRMCRWVLPGGPCARSR